MTVTDLVALAKRHLTDKNYELCLKTVDVVMYSQRLPPLETFLIGGKALLHLMDPEGAVKMYDLALSNVSHYTADFREASADIGGTSS